MKEKRKIERPRLPMLYQDEIRNATAFVGGTLRRTLRNCKEDTICLSKEKVLLLIASVELIEQSLQKE